MKLIRLNQIPSISIYTEIQFPLPHIACRLFSADFYIVLGINPEQPKEEIFILLFY